MSESAILMLPCYVNIDNLLTFAVLRGFSVNVILHNIELLIVIPLLFIEYTEQEKIELWKLLVTNTK